MEHSSITAALKAVQARVEASAQKQTKVNVGVADRAVAPYARWLEYGWVQRVTVNQSRFLTLASGQVIAPGTALVMPPRPTFRATITAERDKWTQAFNGACAHYGPEGLRDALQIVAIMAQQDIKTTIANGGTRNQKFEERHDLTMLLYQREIKRKFKSKPTGGSMTTRQPLVKTGAFMDSIAWEFV